MPPSFDPASNIDETLGGIRAMRKLERNMLLPAGANQAPAPAPLPRAQP
jgi:hypothetical protein